VISEIQIIDYEFWIMNFGLGILNSLI